MKTHKPTSQSRLTLYISVIVILGLASAYLFWPAFGETISEAWKLLREGDKEKTADWVRQFGFWGPVCIILFMVAQMFMVVVNVLAIIIITILVYGPVWGSLIAFSGIMLASAIGYAVDHFAGKKLVHKLISEKSAEKVETQVNRYGLWAVAIARVIPVISNDAISFVAGSIGLGFWKFLMATSAGVIPLIGLIAFIGDDKDSLKTGLLWLAGIGVAAFLIFYFFDKRKHKSGTSIRSGKR